MISVDKILLVHRIILVFVVLILKSKIFFVRIVAVFFHFFFPVEQTIYSLYYELLISFLNAIS